MDRYERIFGSAADAMVLVDQDGRISEANPMAERLFGYARSDLVGQQVDLLVPESLRRQHADLRAQYGRVALPRPMGTLSGPQGRRQDGTLFPVEISLAPIVHGGQTQVLAIVRDIGERLRAEAELRESQRFIEAVAKASPPYIYLFDLDEGCVKYLNRSVLAGLDYPVPAQHADRLDEFKAFMAEESDEHIERVLREWNELADGRIRTDEYRLRAADGTVRYFLGRETVFSRDDDGRVRRVLGTLDDITERKAIERSLRDSEARLASIIESALDAVITIDNRQRIVIFNPEAERIFGVAAHEVIGSTIDRFVPPRLRAVHRRHVDEYARAGRTMRAKGESHVLTGVRANGEEFPFAASIGRTGEGDETLMTVKLRDMCGAQEARLAREKQHLAEAASRAKTEFLSRMSHELRTPLNAVLGLSQLLLMHPGRTPLSAEQIADVGHILQAGLHLTELINDLLDISRIELGTLKVEFEDIDLAAVLEEALLMVQVQADTAGVTLLPACCDASPVRAHANAIRLRQVLINLLSNAIKYNRRGGKVRVDVSSEAKRMLVRITDDGIGMTREQLDRLFVPFDRLGRERSKVEGIGIGLALTHELVTLMGGTIHVQSEPGVGTRFDVGLLPAQHDGEQALAATGPTTHTGVPPPQGVVLYIEDDAINALVLERMLASANWPGVRLARAEDAASGIALARTLQPDLVLLDMHLPDSNGVEVLSALRADPATRGLRVIALSASAYPEEVARARGAGADDYWTKPLDLVHFLANIRRELGRPAATPAV